MNSPKPVRAATKFRSFPEAYFIFSKVYRFVYAPIPKAACSTVLSLIYRKFRSDQPDLPYFLPEEFGHAQFHDFMGTYFNMSQLQTEEAEAFLADPEVFKFTFVRNPLDRLASAYLNKFVKERFNSEQWFHTLPVLQAVHGRRADHFKHSISFAQFVVYLRRTMDEILDKHWRPMHCLLSPKATFFVGRVEALEESYEIVRRRTGLPAEIWQANRTPRRADESLPDAEYWSMDADALRALPSLPQTRQMYDERLEAIVRKRYQRDFKLFRY